MRYQSSIANGAAAVQVTIGRDVPPVMVETKGKASIYILVTRAADGTTEERETGSRYGWDEDAKPLRIDYETLNGEEIVRSWAYIEPWEMP